MCSQGVHGGALRCPIYARDLPRPQLVETLKSQFIRRGFELHIPEGAYDENDWTIDEVSVFFQSGGSVKPRSTVIAEQAAREAGKATDAEQADKLDGQATWAGQAATPLASFDGPPFGRLQRPAAVVPGGGGATRLPLPLPGDGGASQGDDHESDDEFAGQWGF